MTDFPETVTFSDGAVLRRIGVEAQGPYLFVDYRDDVVTQGRYRSAHFFARRPRAWTAAEIHEAEEMDRRGALWKDAAQGQARLLEEIGG